MSNNKKYASGLLVLTIIYFVIEVVINFSIYEQLSIASDVFVAESMELWGKIITGLGIGLLLTRYILSKRGGSAYLTFIGACVVAIPLSFIIQNALINYVVNNAEDEDKNKAMLVVATHGTLVPFYTTNHWKEPLEWTTTNSFIYPFGRMRSYKYASFWESRERELGRVSKCAQETSETMGIVKGIDKTFFPYISLLKDIDESAYKQAITDYYMCALEDKKYFEEHTRSTLNQTEILFTLYYEFYYVANNKYDTHEKYTDNLKEAKKIADQQWRAAMNEYFGHKTTIPPGLSGLRFTNHPDVKRWYIEKTGIKDLYPGDKNFKEELKSRIKKDMPYSIIPAYKDVTGEPSAQYLELTNEQIEEQGKKAYKAVIMPFIAMGFSAFFLLLNILLFFNVYVEKILYSIRGGDYSTRNAPASKRTLSDVRYRAFLIFALAWLLFWPSFKNDGVYEELNKSGFKNSAKWVYYHESNLIYIWDTLSNAIKGLNAEQEAQERLLERQQHEYAVLMDLYDDTYMGEPISKEEARKIRDGMILSKEEQKDALLSRAMSDAIAIEHLTKPTHRGEPMTKKQVAEVRKKIESKRQEYGEE